MKVVLPSAFAVLTLYTVAIAAAADEKTLAERLAGTYTIVSGESHGKPIPAERIKGSEVLMGRDTIVTVDADKKEAYAATYTLESNQSPAVIHMISTLEGSRGTIAKGLIRLDGDTVKLIYKLPTGDTVPTNFQTREGQLMVVLKRKAK